MEPNMEMYRLLLNSKDGQKVVLVGETGSHSIPEEVIWDERLDGPMPKNAVIGAMKLVAGQLVVAEDMLAEVQKKKSDEKRNISDRKERLDQNILAIERISPLLVSGNASLEEIQRFLVAKFDLGG